jgi:DNA (cytosine-5)-methyltransferase 1
MKLFEMFAGYGTSSFALKRILGEKLQIVGFSEIDKYAVQCFNQNHGLEIKNFGDATKINPLEIPDFDILSGGFPCQAFSVAGKMQGELDTRGTLFNEIIRIAEVKKPKFMLLENVKGLTSKKFKDTFDKILSELKRIDYVVFWQVLNTKDYGIPQNRERVWFVGIRKDLFTFDKFYSFPEKEELKLFLKDILEDNPDYKYNLSEKNLNHYNREFGSKGKILNGEIQSPTLTSAMGTGGGNVPCIEPKYYLSEKQINRLINSDDIKKKFSSVNSEIALTQTARQYSSWKGNFITKEGVSSFRTRNFIKNNICQTLQSVMSHGNTIPLIFEEKCKIKENIAIRKLTPTEPHHNNLRIAVSGALRTWPRSCSEDKNSVERGKRLELRKDQVSNSITTHQLDSVLKKEMLIRKLTPKECFRLQGFLNDEINLNNLSDTQKYKLAGNGQSVNVVEKIYYNLLKRYDFI